MRKTIFYMHSLQVIKMNKLKTIKSAQKTNKGFTLVEILLAISILGIVVAMFTGIIIHTFNIVGPSSQRMSAKQMAELNLRQIARYARGAIDISDIENEIIIDNNETEKVIEFDVENNVITKNGRVLIHNIADFYIESINYNTYTITIKKCILENCDNLEENDLIERKTQIQIRN